MFCQRICSRKTGEQRLPPHAASVIIRGKAESRPRRNWSCADAVFALCQALMSHSNPVLSSLISMHFPGEEQRH